MLKLQTSGPLFATLQGPSCPPTSLPSPVRCVGGGSLAVLHTWGPPHTLVPSASQPAGGARPWGDVGGLSGLPRRGSQHGGGRWLLPRSSNPRACTYLPERGGLWATGEEQKREEDRRTQPRAFVIRTQQLQDGQGREESLEGSTWRRDQSFGGEEDERFFSHVHFSAFSKFSTMSLYCFYN